MPQSFFGAKTSSLPRKTDGSRPVTPTNRDNAMTTMSNRETVKGPNSGRFDISALISPPDAVYDDFSSSAVARILPKMAPSADHKLPKASRQDVPPSPPISNQSDSPLELVKHNVSPTPSISVPVKDPILFPSQETPSRPVPLFGPHESADRDADRIIHDHIRATGASSEGERPTEEEYRMVLRFKSNVMQQFQANQRRWLNQEKALLAADRAASYHARPSLTYHARPVAKPRMAQPQLPKPQPIRSNLNRVQKPAKNKEPRVVKQQAPRPIRTSPGTTARSTIRAISTPEPRVRTVAPNREDKNFDSVPDYCPPLSSLGNKSLKVDWKGNALDLSKDPHAHLLHPEELNLAANLRLDCATYLTSKRRIFESRRECYLRAPPKPFRKTDAQQACNIDVNKASKLWTAYDSVGWLDDRWVPLEERFPKGG